MKTTLIVAALATTSFFALSGDLHAYRIAPGADRSEVVHRSRYDDYRRDYYRDRYQDKKQEFRYYESSKRTRRDVQRELARRGYYRGPIDGDLGRRSREAIRHYQVDRRLPASGHIDRALLRSLRLI